MIIVVSDVHLGYKKSDKDSFNNFIDSDLTKLDEEDHLVLLGDIFDFWRENFVEVTTEYKKNVVGKDVEATNTEGMITKKLYLLQKKNRFHVHYIVGNHDYSILYFSERNMTFPFLVNHRNLRLSVNGRKFCFTHGYEFEVLANFVFITIEEYEKICKDLCDVRSTTIGKIESGLWSVLHPHFLGKTFEDRHTVVKSMAKSPKARMKELHPPGRSLEYTLLKPRNKIEELAMSPVARSMLIGGDPDETLIFGHTHSPLITEDSTVINSGSWVKDNNYNNTFVEIDNNGDVFLRDRARSGV
jgi:UDP-2,3-diacylglucosamine pyrophosphatase LpxH